MAKKSSKTEKQEMRERERERKTDSAFEPLQKSGSKDLIDSTIRQIPNPSVRFRFKTTLDSVFERQNDAVHCCPLDHP
mgnify:FL=1